MFLFLPKSLKNIGSYSIAIYIPAIGNAAKLAPLIRTGPYVADP